MIARRQVRRTKCAGITRTELLATLAILALLILVIFPAMATSRPRSGRITCANNLRQIGMAMQMWGSDNNDRPPFEVPVVDGGTYRHPLAPNTWLHFAWLSNELRTAQILFCPSDVGKPAQDFSGDPDTGYLHPNFANRATSYFLTHWFTEVPTAALAGDRNLRTDLSNTTCSRFLYTASTSVRPAPNLGWTTGLHETSGNLLRFDGHVDQLTSQGLRDAVFQAVADNGRLHFVIPR